MRNRSTAARSVLPGLVLLASSVLLAPRAAADAKHYVCPPCGMPCDAAVYDRPGTCPKCGLTLIDQEVAKAQAATVKKVAILLFDGVQVIDFSGPYEIFQAAEFDVFTVAARKEPIRTVAGLTVVPKYSFADAPAPDVLVVPGGGIAAALASGPTLEWVRDTTARVEHTMSVCNGAFILAKAGLLDGLTATTTHSNIARLKAEYPKTRVVDDQRFVDNGKIITTGGLTAGIDGALHVVSLMRGKGVAQSVALGEEYGWQPSGGFVRGVLADVNVLPWIDSSLDGAGTWRLVSTEGTTDHWEIVAEGTSDLSAAELNERFGKACATRGNWTRVEAAGAKPSSEFASRWTFVGRDGKPWRASFAALAVPGTPRQFTLKLTLERAG